MINNLGDDSSASSQICKRVGLRHHPFVPSHKIHIIVLQKTLVETTMQQSIIKNASDSIHRHLITKRKSEFISKNQKGSVTGGIPKSAGLHQPWGHQAPMRRNPEINGLKMAQPNYHNHEICDPK